MRLYVKKICEDVIQYHIDQMHSLSEDGKIQDAECVYEEIRSWIIDKENLEVLTLDYINDYFDNL